LLFRDAWHKGTHHSVGVWVGRPDGTAARPIRGDSIALLFEVIDTCRRSVATKRCGHRHATSIDRHLLAALPPDPGAAVSGKLGMDMARCPHLRRARCAVWSAVAARLMRRPACGSADAKKAHHSSPARLRWPALLRYGCRSARAPAPLLAD
jgi:hypothetical protein